MTSLTPFLVLRGAITTTAAGLVLLVYLIGSSVLQPVFGLLSDRSGRRIFAVLGPIWIGLTASLFGWAGNALTLLGLAGLGGIGTAAFHPQAASMVNRMSRRNKGWSMSLFAMGGNIGFAIGPALAAGFATVGLHWTPVILIPGLVLTISLTLYAPHLGRGGQTLDLGDVRRTLRRARRTLSLLVAVIAIRSGAQVSLIVFMPLYFHARGEPAQIGSVYVFVMSLGGAFGGLIGGRLSDIYGRKIVVVTSLLLSSPLLVLALLSTGPVAWPLIVLAGAVLLASASSTVVQGQELLPTNTGIASGLTLGLAFGLSGIVTSSLSALSDHIGITSTIFIIPFLALVAAGLAWLIPSPRIRQRAGELPL
jgi:FSR family fosmidomycin resistance protein-like MFS transporter